MLLALLSACTSRSVPYKALDGTVPDDVGHTAEHLGGDTYRIEYWGGDSADYPQLTNHLRKYADELCLSDFTLTSIEKGVFVAAVSEARHNQSNIYDVSAAMVCSEVNTKLMAKSSVSR